MNQRIKTAMRNRIFVSALALACTVGCAQRLPPQQCNVAVASWNDYDRTFAEYKRTVGYFRREIDDAPPATRPRQVMTANIDSSTARDILAKPPLLEFTLFPDVSLAVQDVSTDIDQFLAQLDQVKMLDSDSAWTTVNAPIADAPHKLIAFTDIPKATTGTAAFTLTFGPSVARMNQDYNRSLELMRKNYAMKCGGDSSEIRSADDF